MKIQYLVLLMLFLSGVSCKNTTENADYENKEEVDYETLFVGTYTKKEGHVDGKATGVYVLKMNRITGELTLANVIRETVNPSYLTVHPNKKWLYVVNEVADGNRIGTVAAYEFTAGLNIKKLNQVSSKGDAPCHVSIDKSGKFVLVANYMETIASYRIKADGSLSEAISVIEHQRTKPEEVRQETGHPHKIQAAIDENTVLVTDLGLDKVLHYQLDSSGVLTKIAETETAFKSGPRHFDNHPTQPWIYVLNELNSSVEGFNYTTGNEPMQRFQTIKTLKENTENNGPSAIHIHPNGKFLYTANRGLNGSKEQSISIFSIDSKTGQLTLIGKQDTNGEIPRDFAISPSGKFLLAANQNSDTIVTFKINTETGMLEPTNIVYATNTPVCLKFL